MLPVPTVRIAVPTDAAVLAAFSCSQGAWYEDEVEDFIRNHSLAYADHAVQIDHQLLLLETPTAGLVAVGAHEQALMKGGMTGTHLAVGAVAVPYQGQMLDDGTRLSDLLLDVLLSDASSAPARGATPRAPAVHVVVANENARSLSFLRRRGFGDDEPDSLDSRYSHLYARIA